jgi:hypothetical protein
MKKIFFLFAYIVTLTGCAEFEAMTDPAVRTSSTSSTSSTHVKTPVERNKAQVDDSPEKQTETKAKIPTTQPVIVDRSANELVLAGAPLELIKQAEEKYNQGEYPSAAALAERALRIQPKSPLIYHLLAETRLKMGLTVEAKQLALRGKSYTSKGSALQMKLNDLLALINNTIN